MAEVLIVLLVIATILVLVPLVSVALIARSLDRQNRVSPQVPSPAPLGWLASPARGARLHRRLRDVVTTLRHLAPAAGEAPPTLSVAHTGADLERHAVTLDGWLVWTRRAPSRVRRRHYDEIERQVRQIETLTLRLTRLEPDNGRPAPAPEARDALTEIAEQIDHLEAAHAEVCEAEAAAGTRAMHEIEAGDQADDPARLARATWEAQRADTGRARYH